MATFNGRPIEKKLRTMKFRTKIDGTGFSVNDFIERHPNIDILSISTSFVSFDYGVTAIWYMEGNKPDPEMNSGAPEPEKYVLKCYDGRYVYRYTPGSSIIELTPDRTFSIVFSKARAEEMLKKFGSDYEMEEV